MPTRRDDDESDGRPRRRPPRPGGGGRLVLILLLAAGGLAVLCCGGCAGLLYFLAGRQVTVLDATRAASARGGTNSVTATVRVAGDAPGGFVRGDYYFLFKAGSRQSVHNVGLRGGGGGEFKSVFATPELADQPGPVLFWVERRDGASVFRVSPVHTIP